jgi:hypothetical protein
VITAKLTKPRQDIDASESVQIDYIAMGNAFDEQ